MLLTLKRGRDIPHLSFSLVKWRLRKTHCLPCPSPSSQDLPWNPSQAGRKETLSHSSRGKNRLLSELWSLVWGRLTFGDVL